MSRKRAILVGAGGFGAVWVNTFLPDFADRIEVVGIVDINAATLAKSGEALGVPGSSLFTDIDQAFSAVEADFCILVIQPHLRLNAIRHAVRHSLPVLMEKPMSDSWETSLRILELSRTSGIPIAVVQNYPHTNRIRTVKAVMDGGSVGKTSHIVARFASDYTAESAGGAFRHQVPYAMIFESMVHHFDQLRNLSGSDAAFVSGQQWNPSWSTFGHPSMALFQVEMANGVACQIEVNHLAKGTQNGWGHEHYRIECEHGAIEVGADDTVRTVEHLGGGRMRVSDIAPVNDSVEGHQVVIEAFINWIDGGPPPQSAIEDNIYTTAMTFGAVEAVRSRTTIDVAKMLVDAGLEPVSPRFTNCPKGTRVDQDDLS